MNNTQNGDIAPIEQKVSGHIFYDVSQYMDWFKSTRLEKTI